MFRGGGGENHRPPRAMPLSRIPRPQVLGEIPYDPQSKEDQRTYQTRPLQNGNAQIHPPPPQAGGLDRVHRPEGCIPPRPYRTRIKGPVRLYSGRGHVPLQGSALRPSARTAPVHKTGRVRGGLPQTEGPKIVLLSGRLASGGRDPGRTVPAAALSSPDCAGPRLSRKLEEIGARTHAAPDLPRSRHRSTRQLARPSPDRVNTIMAAALRLCCRRQAPARVWLQFLGYLASLVDVLPDCRLHMRPLQIHLLRYYSPSRDLLTRLVPIPPTIRLHLVRWSRRDFLSSGNPLRVPQSSITVTTDASHLGWGGHCLGNTAFGDWPRADTLSHINVLEFLAVLLSLRAFLPLLRRRTVLIRTDNVTVAAYINKQGGTHSTRLNALAALLWKWCRREGIFPIASHIPGQDNLIADFLSRGRVLPSEWTLHPMVMDQIILTLGPLQVDLFASVLHARLPRYCSRVHDPAAWRIDAFSFQWKGFRGYAFPPISLIPRILRKIREDQARVVLIAPWWPRRNWFPELVGLLTGPPRTLPQRSDLIAQPISQTLHPRLSALHLTAWPLSGEPAPRRASLTGLLPL